MKRSGRVTFVVVALLIFAFAFVSFFGVSNYYGDTKHVIFKGTDDIRWGIDIQGGVEAIFTPDVAEDEGFGHHGRRNGVCRNHYHQPFGKTKTSPTMKSIPTTRIIR